MPYPPGWVLLTEKGPVNTPSEHAREGAADISPSRDPFTPLRHLSVNVWDTQRDPLANCVGVAKQSPGGHHIRQFPNSTLRVGTLLFADLAP